MTSEAPERPNGDDRCELCEAARLTPWYHECPVCWVAECEACAVPMVVWRSHGTEPEPDAVEHMKAALVAVVVEHFGYECWLDHNMRTVPDHFHVHARPTGGFTGHQLSRPHRSGVENAQ